MENAFQDRHAVGVEDFVLLENYKSHEAFLDNLKKRFQEDLIYTYIGSVLVSVNPYKQLPIYDARHMERYRGQNFYELPPHVFAIADTAYRAVVQEYRDECILISGESGSGKTEASKKILQFIAQTSKHGGNVQDVKEKLLACNPLFEAFGNATTTRNDNSSRFGKYMDIEVGVQGFPIGGHVLDYLLERTRVVHQATGERNFHIFYQILQAEPAMLQRLKLSGNWKDYWYLSQGVKKGFNNSQEEDLEKRWEEEFRAVSSALDAVNFSSEERNDLFYSIAAIMHLGNVQFVDNGDTVKLQSDKEASIAASLVGCSADDLIQSLTHRGVHARQDKVLAHLNKEQAITSRDSLAKAIYAKTFEWLVKRVNTALASTEKSRSAVIGLLDIYGFEVFEQNGFEQFCINYCNEKLQQLFIELTLRSEQLEYVEENIPWEPVEYFDNQVICMLIEAKPFGLIPLLDDECLRPGRATNMTYLEKMRERHVNHAHLQIRRDQRQFMVRHYAGDVIYDVEGFMDKNGELLHRDQRELVVSCNNMILKSAFTDQEATSLKRSTSTATQFKQSLAQLMVILKNKDPLYIRCIRPNDVKAPRVFNENVVGHQVKYLGLMENLRVRRAGYAYRRGYAPFLKRYKSLCPTTWPSFKGNAQEGVAVLMKHLAVPQQEYALGKTKVFVRLPKTIFSIEDAFQKRKHELATKIIALWKGRRQRIIYVGIRKNIIVAQTQVRGFLAMLGADRRRRAVKTLRDFIRGFIQRHAELSDVNRKFWIQTRINYLERLAKDPGLPKSVRDKSWPKPPPSMAETSELLRKLHMKNRVLKYCKSCSAERKAAMEEKIRAEDLFKGKKASYLSTVPQMFLPVRISPDPLSGSRLLCFEQTIRQPNEKTIYVTDCAKFDRRGFKQRDRTIAVTTRHLYFLEPHKEVFVKKRMYRLEDVERLTVSSNKDGVIIITVMNPEQNGKPATKEDWVFHVVSVIEFVVKVVGVVGEPSVLEIIPNGKRSLTVNGSNGAFVEFGVGQTEAILSVNKVLQVVAANPG